MLKVNEVFKSIQGESSHTGRICTFIRLCGCNLRCDYCDTTYAFDNGKDLSIEDILQKVEALGSNLVEITGGEPLCQEETPILCKALTQNGYEVLIETNGSQDISPLADEVKRIVDIKCPDSGSFESFLTQNLEFLKSDDECKFVISSKRDFNWACRFIDEYQLNNLCSLIFSPNSHTMNPEKLAQMIISKNAPVRLGLQMHKVIWGDKRGV